MSNNMQLEKRRYVRIIDSILLKIRTISEAESLRNSLIEQSLNSDAPPISHQLKMLDDQLAMLLHKLGEKSPQLARVIGLLNKKVDAISHHILRGEIGNEHQEQEVSISASGLGFNHTEPLPINEQVAIDIMLQPVPYRIIVPARIIACESESGTISTDEQNFYIRAEFSGLTEEDEEILIQHIIRKQSQLLKQRRLSS